LLAPVTIATRPSSRLIDSPCVGFGVQGSRFRVRSGSGFSGAPNPER
jgi:hypothetical protein